MQDHLKKGREHFDDSLEELFLLCELVEPPKGELEHIHYFCGNAERYQMTFRGVRHSM